MYRKIKKGKKQPPATRPAHRHAWPTGERGPKALEAHVRVAHRRAPSPSSRAVGLPRAGAGGRPLPPRGLARPLPSVVLRVALDLPRAQQ